MASEAENRGTTPFPLILASASPRRRVLLMERGFSFEVAPAMVVEITPDYLSPGETVLYNAQNKARTISRSSPEAGVLGVDTLVAFEGTIFGKPADMSEAMRMLRRLNGREHEVFSGVWLTHARTGLERGFVEVTRVHFRSLTDTQLHRYAERIGPLDKAGAYAAQEDGGELIKEVEGSFTNVVGLPMERFEMAWREFTTAVLNAQHLTAGSLGA